jgi:hypothetical protein
MRYRDRLRAGGWSGVAVYLAIALGTLAVLSYLLKKSDRADLTKGALMVMVMYLAAGAFLLLASRVFITKREDSQ